MAVRNRPELFSKIDLSEIDSLKKEIDKSLNSHLFLKNERRGPRDNPYWRVTFPSSSLSTEERAELVKRYTNAGWFNVEIYSSEEGGERPGLYSITLYQFDKPQS